jgi:hypothetical protein
VRITRFSPGTHELQNHCPKLVGGQMSSKFVGCPSLSRPLISAPHFFCKLTPILIDSAPFHSVQGKERGDNMFNDGGGWSTGTRGRSFGDAWIIVKCLGIPERTRGLTESGGEDRDRA